MSFEDFKAVYAEAYELGPQGLHHLPAECGDGLGPEHRRSAESADRRSRPCRSKRRAIRCFNREPGEVIYMKRPLERREVLPGFTYKLKWPESDHAIYITINDILQDGRRRPFEIFINSKNMEHYAWTVALTRMISAVFRRGGDVSFVVEELKAVFDPRGGQWMGGKYVPSLLAAIGGVIERHLIDTGFLKRDVDSPSHSSAAVAMVAGDRHGIAQCPRCGEAGLIFQEGCATLPQLRLFEMQLMRRLTAACDCSIYVPMNIHGTPLSSTLLRDTDAADRFWYWRGQSGRRYIHSVYSLSACPPLPGASISRCAARRIAGRAQRSGAFPPFSTAPSPSAFAAG